MIRAIIFSIIVKSFLFCQVNIEALRAEDNISGIQNHLELDFSFISGNSDVLAFDGTYRFNYLAKSGLYGFLIARANHSYEEDDSGDISVFSNKAFGHLRIAKPLFPQTYFEGFTQKEFNQFIDLENRELVGMGFRFNPLNQLYLGTGFMSEMEQYKEPSNVQEFMKSTSYINYSFSFLEFLEIQNIIYYQFKFEAPKDYRLLWDGKLKFSGIKNVSFHINCHYRYDISAINPEGSNYFEVSNGLGFQF